MLRKVLTDQRKSLDEATICDLLKAKINNSNPCYENSKLISEGMLSSVKTATRRSVSKSPKDSTLYSQTECISDSD